MLLHTYVAREAIVLLPIWGGIVLLYFDLSPHLRLYCKMGCALTVVSHDSGSSADGTGIRRHFRVLAVSTAQPEGGGDARAMYVRLEFS